MRRISCDPKPKMPEEPEKDGPSSEDSLEDVEAHHCPICLNRPRRSDRAVPDCCGHVFCSACILRWAQMVQSCPVDRRPFRAIHLQEGVKLLVDTQRQSDTGRSSEDLEKTQKETIITRKPNAQTCWLDERVRGRKKGKQSCRSLLIGHQLSFRHSGQEATVGILNCVITESLDVCVEEGDIQWRRLMRKDLRIPEFPPEPVRTALMPRRSHTRLRFSVISSNQPFSAASVPQGHMCAVTCPKGEEKKGSSRASGSKSCKPGDAVGTRRSSRLTQVPDSSAQTTDPEPSCPTDPISPQNSHGSHTPSWGNSTETEATEKEGDGEESEVVNHKVDEDTEDGQSEELKAEVEASLSSHQLDDNQEPDDKGQNMDTGTWMSSSEDQCVSPDASDQVDESTNISNSIDEDNPIHSHNDIGPCEPTLSEAQVCDAPEPDQDCPSPSQPAPQDVLDEPTSAEVLEDQNPEPDTTVEIIEQESSSICPSDQKPDVPEDCADRSPGDNTDPCPMECDSPTSESEPQADIPQISHPEVQKKDERPRRSRFHSAATTWSPSRESRRSRSPVREHRSRSPSRRHERKHEEKRNRSHERRRRSSSRSRDPPGRRSPSRDRSDPGGSPRRRSWTGRDGWRDRGSVCNSNRSEKPDNKAAAVPNDNPDWVRERERTWTEPRREETGPDRSAHRSSGQYGESADNWRQRGNSSGASDGSDPHSRFNEGWAGGKRRDPETELALDRSGWSSASSWAIRRTLPADVQNYYSRRERGGWSRQEDEHSTSKTSLPDSPQTAPVLCQPVAVPVPQPLPVMSFPIRPMLPPAAFAAPLRPPGPLLQSLSVQGLLPPPPPPPPVLQVPPESFPSQVLSGFPGPGRVTFKVPTTKAAPGLVRPVGTAIVAQPSSTTSQPVSQSRVQADSSKKEKKLQIQERAVSEVKAAIKPFYQKNEINKDEYKEIVRKAVDKVCHSKSGEVNASKVAILVKAYVDKYKHSRRNRAEKS